MRPKPRFPGPVRVAATGLALALVLATAATARAQAPAASAGEPIPLPAYVPAGNEVIYFEFQGLDAHAEAWRKTAAYKILNDTPAGAMLEDVLAQLLSQTVIKDGGLKISGTEAVAILKHVARNGFLFALTGTKENRDELFALFVLRGAFKDKALRPALGRLLTSMADPKVKPKYADADGHRIVVQKTVDGESFAWWVEDSRKEDLLIVPPSKDEAILTKVAARVFATVEGKTPSLANHPDRLALLKDEDGVTPVAVGFVDIAALPAPTNGAPPPPALGLGGIKKLDYRLGFQDAETVSIFRVVAPKPHEGLLSLMDGPTFEKSGLPPVPEGVEGFSVTSIDLKATYDTMKEIAKALKPESADQIAAWEEAVKGKTKLRLREDILAHLGPRFAFYVAPSPKATADPSKPAAPSPLAALAGMLGPLGSMFGDTVPRATLVADVDDANAVGRSLDELMIRANQGLRDLAPMLAMLANGPPGGDPSRPAAKGARPSALEFKMVPGAAKVYMLSFPQALSLLVPQYVRPTIRVGPKQMVFSVSADSARQALEVKGGGAASTTFASALQAAPAKMLFLSVNDPGEAISTGLASLPSKLQAAMNESLKPPGMPGTPVGPGMPGGPPGRSGGPGGGPPAGYPGASGGPPAGYPGGSGSGGRPPLGSGSGGAPPGGEAKPDVPGGIVLTVDAAKIPSASAIKPLIAPGATTVSSEADGVRIITRFSFPDLVGLATNLSKANPRKPPAADSMPAAEAPAAPAQTQPQPGGPRRGPNRGGQNPNVPQS